MRTTSFMPRIIAVLAFAFPLAAAHAAAPTKFAAGAGEIRDFIAVSSTVGFAGTVGGGLWKTSDSGTTWAKTTLVAKTVWKVSHNPSSSGGTLRVYAATDSGLFRSLDAGATWTQLTQDPARAVAVMPTSAGAGPDTVLVGVPGVGVIKTTDSGASFTRTSAGLDSTEVTGIVWYAGSGLNALAILRCNLEDALPPLFEGPWGGVFRSSDGGVTWSNFNTGLPNYSTMTNPCLTAVASNGTAGSPIVAVGMNAPDDSGTSYHINGTGSGWVASGTNPFGVTWMGPDFANTSGFWRGSNHFGIQHSTNGDVSYSDVTTGATDPDFVTTAYAAGSFTATVQVASMNGLGLFRTTTGFGPWSLPTTPITADRVSGLSNHNVAVPSRYWMSLRNATAMRSDDSGVSWIQFAEGTQTGGPSANRAKDALAIGAHPANGNVVGLALRPLGLYEYNDSTGNSWNAVAGLSGSPTQPQSVVISPGGKVFYSRFDLVTLKSTATGTDLGSFVTTGLPAVGGYRVRLGALPESRVYVLMYDGLPYRSNDGGANWALVNAPASGFQPVQFLDVAEKDNSYVVASANKGIYYSTDGGVNFQFYPAAGLPETSLAALAYAGTTLFGAGFGGQLYCSTNDGASWISVTGGNLGSPVTDMKFMNGAMHILTDGGGFYKKDAVCS